MLDAVLENRVVSAAALLTSATAAIFASPSHDVPQGGIYLLTEAEAAAVVSDNLEQDWVVGGPLEPPSPSASTVALSRWPCRFVLVKTSILLHATYESLAMLKYELAIHERIASVVMPSFSHGFQELKTLRPVLGRPPLQAHLRTLTDGRSALVMQDDRAPTLQQSIYRLSSTMKGQSVANPATAAATALIRAVPVPNALRPDVHVQQVFSLVNLQRVLMILSSVAMKLHRMHSVSLVHKALHPSTILVHPTGEVRFINLTATNVLLKDKAQPDMNWNTHTASAWMYMSPEQSGRANRLIDSRSDLYSLGHYYRISVLSCRQCTAR
jgi:serine/threonine protein kinase